MKAFGLLAIACVLSGTSLVLAGGGGGEVPEIGPNSLASALTVVIGGFLLLARSRKNKE